MPHFTDGQVLTAAQLNAMEADTDAVAADLATHAADTTTHGTAGDVVGTSDTQTLTNKTLTAPKLNEDVAVTASATEVNILDGATLSTAELNFVDGVTSAIQTQLDAKQPLDADLTAIAGLTATTDNLIVSVASAWASRTPAQVRTTLALVPGTDVQAFNARLAEIAALVDPNADRFLVWDDSADDLVYATPVALLNYTVDGGGSAITTGVKGFTQVPYACTVTGWDLVADQSGSIVVDVWNDSYANFPPTVADTIAGSEKPTLSGVQKNQDTSLSTWTTALAANSWLGFNVDSVATVQRVTVSLRLLRVF